MKKKNNSVVQTEEQAIDRYIGSKLKSQRIKCGISQSKLAEAVGCSYQLIQKQEAGEARIQAGALYTISNILGVTPNYFYESFTSSSVDVLQLPVRGDFIKNKTKKRWNILLIEDNPEDEFLFREVFSQMVLPCTFNIKTCYDGVDALSYLRSSEVCNTQLPDIIFIDLNLPKKDGFTLLKDLKRDARLLYIPVLVLTNSVNAEEMFNCYKLQASGYICKLFDIDKFKDKIESALHYWTSTVATPRNY